MSNMIKGSSRATYRLSQNHTVGIHFKKNSVKQTTKRQALEKSSGVHLNRYDAVTEHIVVRRKSSCGLRRTVSTWNSPENVQQITKQNQTLKPYLFGLFSLALAVLAWKNPALNGIATKSGFTAAFSLIFVSELGDKTFFMSALLAAQRSRLLVLIGSMAALSIMTVVSVVIGMIFQRLPAVVNNSGPVMEYVSAGLLVLFGLQTLKGALSTDGAGSADEEFEGAKEAVQSDMLKNQSIWTTLLATFTLIFTAEWGDRSMFATIALVTSKNPIGVAAGAIAGHLIATMIAIAGGSMVGKHLSEKIIGVVGGVLYIAFAGATLMGAF